MSDKFQDPVIAEIHKVRAAMLEAAGGDIGLLMEQVAERQRQSKHRIITQPLRDLTPRSVAPALLTASVSNGPTSPATDTVSNSGQPSPAPSDRDRLRR